VGVRFACGAGLALGLACWFAQRPASAAGIEVRCLRLSRAHAEELDARARLALAVRPRPELFPLAVVCDAKQAWLETAGRNTVPIDESHGILEGTLETLDNLLNSPPTPAPVPVPVAPPPPAPPTPITSPTAPPESPASAHPPPSAAGGLGLAAVSEPTPHAGHVSLGPRLDIALPIRGPFSAVASEAVKFGLDPGGGPSTSLVDVQVGVAWGAPTAPRRPLGFVLLVGLERFAASPADDKLRSADVWTATASLGARAAVRAGPLELWLGLDGVARATTPETPDPVRASLPRVGAAVSLGFFYPAESAVREHVD
jgi:hypothetical protein